MLDDIKRKAPHQPQTLEPEIVINIMRQLLFEAYMYADK